MSGPFKNSMAVLATGVFLVSVQAPAHAQNKVPTNPVRVQGGNHRGEGKIGRGPHLGDWLRMNRGKPLDQQKKLLESDPDFKKLPPERQEELKQRLQKFNNLQPAKQDLILQRLDKLNRMTPQQRAMARALVDRMRLLSQERRVAVRQFFHALTLMTPDQRQKALTSDDFNTKFNPEERDIIHRGLELSDQTEGAPENEPSH
jgi:hypothetical protein